MRIKSGALRRRTTSIVSAAAFALILTSISSAQAASPAAVGRSGGAQASSSTPARSSAANLIDLKGVKSGPKTITLITGDQVKLIETGGRYAITTEPGPRPHHEVPVFMTRTGPDGVFVIPSDAAPAVQAKRLDRQLFNVKYLAENGYADDQDKQLPVIVQYPASSTATAIRTAAAALPASTATRELTSIHGSALHVSKAQAGTFWSSVRSATAAPGKAAPSTLSAGVDKVWLDPRVKANLDVSVPLIGAPAAWQAGQDGSGVKVAILDTGVDATHPDLAGKIADSKSFVPGEGDVKDGFGHGTHVASTVVGSGAASGSKYKGVAPGAQLVIGKVLDDSGNGDGSGIIDGMEWAASSGAKVVNMSLGTRFPSDGTDPLSLAANDLTAATGTLFVVAAGNSGPSAESIGSPGAADSVLTVAATDKSDQLASFSSRGPRLDGALKPDIAAPGVDIVAARADGTNLGPLVGQYYTVLKGTSMATPHVAGSVAILSQRHPDWNATQLKAALMSTAKDDGYTVYEQGAGRVDIGRADTGEVFATTANLDYGMVEAGQAPTAKQVGYTNLSDRPVTLTLSASLRGPDGEAAEGALSTDETITVPANGTATTTVTLTSTALDLGRHTGAVLATDSTGEVRLTTPVGLLREPPKVKLTIRTLDLDGAPADIDLFMLTDVTGDRGDLTGSVNYVERGVLTAYVPVGEYSFLEFLSSISEERHRELWALTNPEIVVTGDTSVTLDSRKAQKVIFDTPKPSAGNGLVDAIFERTTVVGEDWGGIINGANYVDLFVSPTQEVTKGKFVSHVSTTRAQPEVTMSMRGEKPIALHPRVYPHRGSVDWTGDFTGLVPFSGIQTDELVDVGVGKPEDLAGLDLRGKLALLEETGCWAKIDRIHNLRAAGAAGVVVWPSSPLGVGCWGGPVIPLGLDLTEEDQSRVVGIPYVSISPPEARALRDRLTHEPVKLTVSGTPQEKTAYDYQLIVSEHGSVPNSLHYKFTDDDFATVDMELHATKPTNFELYDIGISRDQGAWSAAISSIPIQGPTTRRQYVGPISSGTVRQRLVTVSGELFGWDALRVYDRPVHLLERWNTGPLTPGAITASDSVYAVPDPSLPWDQRTTIALCQMCRQGDTFYPLFVRANANGQWHGEGFSEETHLYSGDKEIPLSGLPIARYNLPKEDAAYRLTLDDLNTKAEWTFHSGTVSEDVSKPGFLCVGSYLYDSNAPCRPEPLVFVSYDLGSSQAMDNTVAAGRGHTFQVSAYHSPSAAPMPKIAGLKLWYSTDDGANWKTATLKRDQDGRYTATANYPKLADTTGAVSLKVEAWDADGNRIEQTTDRAFKLRG